MLQKNLFLLRHLCQGKKRHKISYKDIGWTVGVRGSVRAVTNHLKLGLLTWVSLYKILKRKYVFLIIEIIQKFKRDSKDNQY